MAGEYGKTGYGYRQAVLTVYSVSGGVEIETSAEIFFRQPFNRLGYALSFAFQKSYLSGPFADCHVEIQNPSKRIVDCISQYNYREYKDRPRVEIRAGYSVEQVFRFSDANKLKRTLPLVYTGYPYEFYDNKVRGGRVFSFTLYDCQAGKLYGSASKYSGAFPAGSYLAAIISRICSTGSIKYSYDTIAGRTDFFEKTQIKSSLFYSGRFILQDILPALARQYGFTFSALPDSSLVFRSVLNLPEIGSSPLLSAATGMIETPARINRTHWQVKSLFGLPRLFFPGDWVKVESPFFQSGKPQNQKNFNVGDNVTGCVIDGDYSFDDSVGMCTYIIAPEGEPVTLFPFIRQ